MGQALLECVARERPDVLFVFKGTPLTADILHAVRNRFHIPRVNWCPDDPFRYLSDEVYPCYELFCVKDSTYFDPLRQRGAKRLMALPFACDPTVHRRIAMDEGERRRWQSEICFVGSYHPRREAFLDTLTAWDLAIWGPGWERLPQRSPLRRHLRGGAIRAQEWVRAYNAASVVLNISHPQERDISLPMRVFEALGCEAALLTTWSPLAEQFFQVGEELETFRTSEELREKVRYYLDHPAKRRHMAQRGHARVYAEHTYAHRMRELIRVVEEVTASR
jgi:spore maturation protein CgeB